MHKSGLIIIILGLLIVTGLVVSVVGDRITLEGISQGNGQVDEIQTVTITSELDRDKTSKGVFAVQAMEFKEDTLSAIVLGPSNTEIISERLDTDTIESEFDVLETGTYQLIIQSSDDEEVYVAGAIGPLPDATKKLITSIISSGCIISGMIGLVVIGILGIKNKKRDQLR